MITMPVLNEFLQQFNIDFSVHDLYPIITRNMKYSETIEYAYRKIIEESQLPEKYQTDKAKHEKIIKEVIIEVIKEINERREAERLASAKKRKQAQQDYIELMNKMEEVAPFVEKALTSASSYGTSTINIRRTWEELQRYFVGIRV